MAEQPPIIERSYTLSELSALWCVSTKFLLDEIKAGHLVSFRMGNRHRVNESDVYRFIESQNEKQRRKKEERLGRTTPLPTNEPPEQKAVT